jgi:hypothetical protein
LSSCPRSSPPVAVLAWLARRLAHLGSAVTDHLPLRSAWTRWPPSSSTGCRTGAPAAWSGACKTEVGDSLDLLLPKLAALDYCQPDGTFVTPWASARAPGRDGPRWRGGVRGRGWPRECSDPAGGPTSKCCTTPSGTPTPPRAWRCRPSTATCCGAMAVGLADATSRSCWCCRSLARCWTPPAWPRSTTGGFGAGDGARALACAGRGPADQGSAH